MNNQKPDFRIFKKYEKANDYATKLATSTGKSHCIWNISKSYLVAVKGYDPRWHRPADMPNVSRVITIIPAA